MSLVDPFKTKLLQIVNYFHKSEVKSSEVR